MYSKLKLLALLHLCIFSLTLNKLSFVPRCFSIFGINLCLVASTYAWWHQLMPVECRYKLMTGGISLCLEAYTYAWWYKLMPGGINLCLEAYTYAYLCLVALTYAFQNSKLFRILSFSKNFTPPGYIMAIHEKVNLK